MSVVIKLGSGQDQRVGVTKSGNENYDNMVQIR